MANAGDGAAARGPVYEAMNFAAMDQYNELWEDGYKGGLPIIYNFNNNAYGMGGQTKGETMAYGDLARLGWHRPEPDERRAHQRLESAGHDRRLPPRPQDPRRGQGPGPAGCRHLSSERPLAPPTP